MAERQFPLPGCEASMGSSEYIKAFPACMGGIMLNGCAQMELCAPNANVPETGVPIPRVSSASVLAKGHGA